MNFILRPSRLIAAFAFSLCALAQAAPVLDTTFGTNGSVRIGVPSGNEDTAYTSVMQADGKVVVAGTSIGRQANAFITRFETGGAADTAFGTNGAVLLSPPASYSWMTPIQLETHADGSLLVVGILYNGFVLARIGAGGELDSGFGSGGMLVVQDTDAFHGNAEAGAIRVATQPDGKILVVTDASANGVFALRFRRFLAQGTPDTSFGTNGERLLGNLPPDFAFATSNLAVAEAAGGFTLAARATFQGGTYLLLRVTGDGALDTSFGSVGFISGYDLGNPRDAPTQLARTATNRYVLIGTALTDSGNPTGYDAVWKVGPDGRPVAAFANNGRLLLADTGTGPGLVEPLSDEGVAIVQNAEDANVRVSRFGASGNPATQFGSGGSMTIAVADRQDFLPVGIHADAGGQLTIAGWGNTSTIFSGTMPIRRGNDVLLAGLTSSGQLRTDFGGGDGITVWNNPAYSNDRIDALRFDAFGRIVLIGYSGDYLLSRLTADGALDASYGVGGRLSPQQSARFTGPARVAQQPDDSIVVASGEAFGSFGSIRAVTAFRATPNGALDGTFQPTSWLRGERFGRAGGAPGRPARLRHQRAADVVRAAAVPAGRQSGRRVRDQWPRRLPRHRDQLGDSGRSRGVG
ncbi:MAG: hypothetical protein IPI73_18005 [Betaproteobacteria bacterium]|nr:hypothetical protein [Betaproteobacteria bacterium]